MALLIDNRDDVSDVIVEPSVVVNVLDHYLRRQEGSTRVIGTLLGSIDAQTGTVHVKSCFAVPHQEKQSGEVAIGKNFKVRMLAFHERAYPNETIVGWYATSCEDGSLISEHSCLIHDFYHGECASPIHLVVNTSLQGDSVDVRAFTSFPLSGEEDESYAAEFRPLRCTVAASDASEKLVISNMAKAADGAAPIDGSVGVLERNLQKLLQLVETSSSYVDDVVSGKREADPQIGRLIHNLVSTMPRVKPELFYSSFDRSLQDLLAICFLSKITKTQMALASYLQ